MVTRTYLGVYDLKATKLVEQIAYNGLSLASPTADKLLDADHDPVAHSVRVYKGKVFLLVSFNTFTVTIYSFRHHRNEVD